MTRSLARLVAFLPCTLVAQDARFRPDDRIVLREFSHVRAVAADHRYIYGVTDGGLIVRDHRFGRWLAPRTTLDGYPTEPVTLAFTDETDQSLWLGTATGLFKYTPLLDRFERAAGMPPLRVPRGRAFDALRERYPFVDGMAPMVLTDTRLRTSRFTDVALIPGTATYWLGTTGAGLVELDASIARFEPHPFGLLSDGVAALWLAPDGVWSVTDGRGRRQGLSFVTYDFQQGRWDEGPPATGFGASVFRAVLGRERALWLASDHGLWRVEPERQHRLWGTGDGLPDASIYSLAQGPAGLWVGTALGLAHIADDETVTVIDRQLTVLALSAARDTVWVGTMRGLGVTWPGAGGVLIPEAVREVADLRGPILGLGRTGDTLMAVTPDRMVWRAGGREAWQAERVLSPEIGVLMAVVGDDGGAWVGGVHGLAWFDYAARAFQVFAGPTVLPGGVRGLAVEGEFLWVATDRGLVRLRKRALVP
ncbi:MAG: hypothetical protein WD934_10350 [Gemmatimonadales bacterium]